MGRAPCCEKVGLKRGRWTAEEDKILMRYIRANGEGSWRSLPKNAGLLRCGKSCRLRWINYLRAGVKRGNISAEEEEIIVKLHAALGNRWSFIAGHLPGRTDNEIKNYWNSHLSRRIDSFTRPSVDGTHMIMDLEMINRRCKRKGGRTSKSAMKKNTSNVQKSEEKQDTMEVLSGILDQNKERENAVLGPPHNRIFCPDEEMEGEERERERLVTKQGLEDDFFCPDDGIEKGWVMSSIEERESGVTDGVLGSCEERESGITGGVLGSCDDRESGAAVRVLGYNEMIESGATGGGLGINEEIESGAMGANEEMGESDGWCSSMGHGFEELGCLQNEWMDWDYLRMDDQTTDGGGETWPWLWGCDLSQDNF